MPHARRLALACALSLALLAGAWPARTGATRGHAPTFSRDVAPILYENCVTCHRPGSIAPFSLATYRDARRRAETIAAVTERGTMPPWKPAERGVFFDERRLGPEQIRLLREWAEAGAPAGDPADLPPLPTFKEGWQLGEPDLVLEVPRPFTIPAEGPDVFAHFVFPVPIEETKYIRAVEVLPGNRRVAHHALGLLDASGKARRLAAADGGDWYTSLNAGFLPSGLVPGYVPGQTARFPVEDTGIKLEPKTDFVLQMHYHPTGRVETDRTRVGLYFARRKPTAIGVGVLLGSFSIDIAPGDGAYTVSDSFKLPADMKVNDVWAHMHMLGKEVRVWAELPDGETRPLMTIDDWDFNWQDTYRYRAPFWLPKGTVIRAEFVYDNSAENPRNPNDPPRRVRIGGNSTDEMAGVVIGGAARNWLGEIAIWTGVVAHYLEVLARAAKPAWRRP
jgi:mono/diheme cytochrome c family protein